MGRISVSVSNGTDSALRRRAFAEFEGRKGALSIIVERALLKYLSCTSDHE